MTHAIFGINVAVFLGMVLAGISFTDPTSAQLIHWGANWGPATMSGQWWRLITSVFLHIGIIHIALNMWCLWDLGSLAESLYGHVTFGAVYLVCGLGGSIGSLIWHQNVVSAGASGAIFGIAGALIASFYLGEFTLPRSAIQANLRSIVLFAAYNLVGGAVIGITDNAAHVGGLVTGAALGALIAIAAPAREHYARRGAVVATVLLLVAATGAWTSHTHAYSMHTQRAWELLTANKPEEAIREIQTALRQRPGYTPARLQLAYAYTEQKRFDAAETELKSVIRQEPKNEHALYQLAGMYTDAKQMQNAKQAYSQLLAVNPNNAGGHYGLGYLLAQDGEDRAAIDEYKIAEKLSADMEGLHYDLGLSYARLKMYDEAIAEFRSEVDNDGDSFDVEVELAKAYAAKRMEREAADALEKAAKLKSAKTTASASTP